MAEVARRQRPWHAALITERAARFHLANGLERIGGALLAEAQNLYSEWGAIGKVDSAGTGVPRSGGAACARHDVAKQCLHRRQPNLGTGLE